MIFQNFFTLTFSKINLFYLKLFLILKLNQKIKDIVVFKNILSEKLLTKRIYETLAALNLANYLTEKVFE
jgi:hypothetical protein